jgi:oxygen-independent coproporphyrinogen-3 oxidase
MDNNVLQLIRKYECSGPRYTSYPPAPVFTTSFGPDDYVAAIGETEERPANKTISLYFHIPFCDTLCYFCGCTTVITRSRDQMEIYVKYLLKEIDLLAPRIGKDREVVQLHWGGGTPTYLTPAQIRQLGARIRERFHLSDSSENSVEVDPRELTRDHLVALRDIGFNRISLGVQDFDPKVQRAVNRLQDEKITRQAIDWSRELGFRSLNLDLIYGLPLQTVDSFSATLDKIIAIAPERLAVYNFAHVPWMKKHQVLIHEEDLPSGADKLSLLMTTIDKLSDAGYLYIGMDHFARPDDELAVAQRERTLHRNFQGYSTKAGSDLYALGMSSISHFGTTYAQNHKTLLEYQTAIERGVFATHAGYRMTADDQLRKFVIMRLMCHLYLDIAETESKFGIDFRATFADALEKLRGLQDDGLLAVSGQAIQISGAGRLFLRNIAMCFDAHLATMRTQRPLYSKTV